jgi:hypothetical protein
MAQMVIADIKNVIPKGNLVIRYKIMSKSKFLKKPSYSTEIIRWENEHVYSVFSKEESINHEYTSYYWIDDQDVHVVDGPKDREKNYLFKGPLKKGAAWKDGDGIAMTVVDTHKKVEVNGISFENCTVLSVLFSDDPENLSFWKEVYAPNIGLIQRFEDDFCIQEIVSYSKL